MGCVQENILQGMIVIRNLFTTLVPTNHQRNLLVFLRYNVGLWSTWQVTTMLDTDHETIPETMMTTDHTPDQWVVCIIRWSWARWEHWYWSVVSGDHCVGVTISGVNTIIRSLQWSVWVRPEQHIVLWPVIIVTWHLNGEHSQHKLLEQRVTTNGLHSQVSASK